MDENITISRRKNEEVVLVTGGSGFIATHCILHLLKKGYRLRTTIRTREKENGIVEKLRSGGADPGSALSFYLADLTKDEGWSEAAEGCNYVLHLASPFPPGIPKNEDELIIPAREGTLRVLRAAKNAGVKRVVLTSSFAAIGYSSKPSGYVFTEKDWSDPESRESTPYTKSKTLAERAAWDFIAREGGNLELSVVNPVMVLGPVLGPDDSTSIELVKRLMQGSIPGCPRLSFGVVDVRDVADLHFRAMITPAAKGERFLAIAEDFIRMKQIAEVLRSKTGEAARKVPQKEIPDWMVRLVAIFDPSIRQILPELGKDKRASNEKAKNMLKWNPRSNEEAIVSTAESLIKYGLL